MAAENGGMPEVEVIEKNGQFRCVDRYGHFRHEWTIARKTSYIQSTELLDCLILWKL